MSKFTYYDFPKNLNKEWRSFIDSNLIANAAIPAAQRIPIQRRSNFAQIATYVFTTRYLKKHGMEKLTKLVHQKAGISKARIPATAQNPFKLGFMLLFGTGARVISPQDLSKWSVNLHYAYLHNTPPDYLIGYIFQEGSYSKIKPKYDLLISGPATNK